jgi:hypothetical protein
VLRAEGLLAAVTEGLGPGVAGTAGDLLEIIGRQIADGFLVELELLDLFLHGLPPVKQNEKTNAGYAGADPPVTTDRPLFVTLE